jgi:hypothetical protein
MSVTDSDGIDTPRLHVQKVEVVQQHCVALTGVKE